MPCRIFSSISVLYPLDASSTLSVVTTKFDLRHCQIFPEGAHLSHLRTTALIALDFSFLLKGLNSDKKTLPFDSDIHYIHSWYFSHQLPLS